MPVPSFSSLGLVAAFCLACGSGRGTIGAMLGQQSDGRLFIRETPPDLAASKKGLQPGDEILLIDGLDVRAMDPQELHARLSGTVDTTVKLTLIRDDRVVRVTLKRTPAPGGTPERQP